MSSPRAGAPLSTGLVAAEFGLKHQSTRDTIQAIRDRGMPREIETYYSLLLDCFAARATREAVKTDSSVRDLASPLLRRICQFSFPPQPTDLFKELYLNLFSKAARHGLGEYYTPDWLAEKVLVETFGGELGDPSKRVLDPACGSGTFLVLIIGHVLQRVASGQLGRRRALELILRNVAGFDVHPLAVRTARTNYLCALGDLLADADGPVDVPVYEMDSVLAREDVSAFDYVVGNPPWVNWESLSGPYRRRTMALWEHYGLFPKRCTAMQTILGAAKYDVSMLLTYVSADRHLCTGGRLGFLVSQSLFKTAAAGQGFRRFRLPDGTPLRVCRVEDLVKLKPFPSTTNRTAILVIEKGRETEYPVNYRIHTPGREACWNARPVAADPSSAWMTARPGALTAIARVLGKSDYRAREGVNTGGANGVFWIEVTGQNANRVRIRNVTEGARKEVPSVCGAVEPELVYPLLRGRNVARWNAGPRHSILITHRPGMKLRAISVAELSRTYRGASSYLKKFVGPLRERPAFKRYFQPTAPFYSLFNIGEYTFAPWKVVWREQALPFTAAVIGPMNDRIVVPDHKLMSVAVDSEAEAHYLCGALNSLPVSAAVAAYTVETQIDTHILEHICVPRFSRTNPVHRRLSAAARQAQNATRTNDDSRLRRAETAVGRCAAELWELTELELMEIREFLGEIGLPGERGGA